MKVLFDIVHPAHVHFFKHLIAELRRSDHSVLVASREKDVTVNLLDAFEIDHVPVSAAGMGGILGQTIELAQRDLSLWRLALDFHPDFVLTRNPSGVHAARLAGALGIFDTDDGRAAGLHFRLAAPFAHVITTPDCLRQDFGPKHVTYPGYKQTAYLHPDHFVPDPAVRDYLGLGVDDRYAIVRFVSMTASHDVGERGLSWEMKRQVIELLEKRCRVFVSSESPLPKEYARYSLDIPPDRLHDALYFSTLLVGDSQTMAAEAAVLGVPNLRVSTFTGRLDYLEELENRYRLTRAFHPDKFSDFLSALEQFIEAPDLPEVWKARRAQMLESKMDVSSWYMSLLNRLLAHPNQRRGSAM